MIINWNVGKLLKETHREGRRSKGEREHMEDAKVEK
jgi:hypothetical protein